jgi:hypothetical protein
MVMTLYNVTASILLFQQLMHDPFKEYAVANIVLPLVRRGQKKVSPAKKMVCFEGDDDQSSVL